MPLTNLRVLLYLAIFLENYDANYYITDHPDRISPPKEEPNVLQDSLEEEIAKTESSLYEKDESGERKEEEWSHPCLPSNESNSLTLTLYVCPPCLPKEDECYIYYYDPMDSFEISVFDEIYACGHDAPMNDT